MRFELVENAREFWKWASVQLHVLATGIVAMLLLDPPLPGEIAEILPDSAEPFAVAVWLVLGILARVVELVKPGALESGEILHFGEAGAGDRSQPLDHQEPSS